ncbi:MULTISPECIES: anti-sigma factor [unclassified Mesorhizobium]|uniref:anti-sigma factor family protein n=1 Tax=unclassified Mesorhizobium TaxID=325217 RepID=UPI000FD7AFFB|nr:MULTISPECIES: anti-sigma factor [unclassified Mesorhizobium]TGQ45783.1 anti-sigma factor [Mesorhizobium sp. M00.F.Ca.ET.216.01.1.1]TIS53266.1 MAG: anti-sigma factor [Mesorhizobium sp.]TIS85678.1 MAG: anti-sigma factor [Mesorhizobium sp.]TJW12940.1 MAG: anti-sigma factor [Mesorhizobium sp.]TJW48078.1 MAG: anti-sigma factor [Mesorhizobium sp.]
MSNDSGLPTNPADLRLLLHALVDGELDAATSLALERRIASDPALAAEHARITASQAAVRSLRRPEVSEGFRARIAAIGTPDKTQALPARSRRPLARAAIHRFGSFDWRAMAASILVTAVLASGATQWVMLSGAPDSFAVAIASGHRRSLLATSPVDVVSSDRHTVKPWLDARIGVSPPAPDLAKDGFALLGGRIEVIGDKPMPALVYRHREHLITLVAAPQETGGASAPVATDLSAGGFSLVHWSDGAFSYWAISDTERPELENFVGRFQAAAAAG